MNLNVPLWEYTGEVIHGRGNGHTVGMPTANLPCPEGKPHPPFGVYASVVKVDGREYMGVTNVGTRPSVDSDARPTIETWLLDFSGDLYGHTISVRLMAFLRPTVRMHSLGEVKEQVKRDADAARRILASRDGIEPQA